MDQTTLNFLIQAVLEIVANHTSRGDVPPTLDEVKAELATDIMKGESAIALWFQTKGLPVPE